MTYNELCNKYGTDKGNKFPNGNCYAEFYENWFKNIKNSCEKILEIGIDFGGSLMANYEYFQNSEILALDIEDKKFLDNDRITTYVLDQNNLNEIDLFYQTLKKENIEFDLIIDDGSHIVSHQQKTFGKFFKLLKPGGLYIIEDLGSSYFTYGTELYGYSITQEFIKNDTVSFLNERPFYSPWIFENDLTYINKNVEYVTIFDKINESIEYSYHFESVNKQPIRSITSIIKKKNNSV